MTDKPIPTGEACAALARTWRDHQIISMGPQRAEYNFVRPYDELTPIQQHDFKEQMLPLLVAVYPQIVADVLNHYAALAQTPRYIETPEHADRITRWLDARADEVQP